MPIILYFALGLLLIALVAGLFSLGARDPVGPRFVAVVCTVLGGVVLPLISCLTVVPANHVGIITNFGSWKGTADSGMHWTAPWSKVDKFPTRNQKSIRDAGSASEFDCVRVKLSGGSSACVDMTVLYTIDKANAEKLWRGWGSFERLNTDLVNRATDDAAGTAYGAYTAEEAVDGRNRAKITDAIAKELKGRLDAQGVELGSVTLGDTHLPEDVQNRINDLLKKDAAIESAKKDKQQAIAEREAAAERQSSLTREALIRECLAVARDVKPQVMPDCGLSDKAVGVTPLVQVK